MIMEDLATFLVSIIQFAAISTLLPLGIVMACGMVIAFLQTLFSIQEQTLSFVIKNTVFLITIFVGFPWWFNESIAMFRRSFSLMSKLF